MARVRECCGGGVGPLRVMVAASLVEHEPGMCRGAWGYIYVLLGLYGFTLFAFEVGWLLMVVLCVHRFVHRLWITGVSTVLDGGPPLFLERVFLLLVVLDKCIKCLLTIFFSGVL